MGFKDAFVILTVCPGGIVFGFYLFMLVIVKPNMEFNLQWPLFATPASALLISIVIALKKRFQQKYTFDNLYYNLIACSFYFVGGLLFMRKYIEIAFYFGFIGNGIAYISSLTYIGFTASTSRCRQFELAGLHLFYFSGVTVGAALHNYVHRLDEAIEKCGQVLLVTSVFILGSLIFNHALHCCNLNDYRRSSDIVWNYYNSRNWLYKNRSETLAIHQRIDNKFREMNFVIVPSKESKTTLFISLALLTNCMIFCNITLTMGRGTGGYFEWNWFFWFMFAATGGVFFSFLLLTVLKPRVLYVSFGIVKCAVLICILMFLENQTSPDQYAIYYMMYFFCMGVLYSTPITMLLEVGNPRSCEIIVSTVYFFQMFLLYAAVNFSIKEPDLTMHSFVRILYVVYVILSAFAILLVQIFAPIPGSLIEIRNYLIGIRTANVMT